MTEPAREERPPGDTRCGFVAVVGAPNVGKSTLVNRLTGTKVTIVSRKAQTTRTTVRGIAIEGASQIVFVDTPGIFAPKRRLERAMVQSALSGAGDADIACLVVDAQAGFDDRTRAVLPHVAGLRAAPILVLNKIDLVPRPRLLALAAELNRQAAFRRTFMVSAATGDGIDDLKAWLAAEIPAGPWLYPEDQVSDAPLWHLAAEITREKLFERLHDELPYASTVETTAWETRKDGSVRIEQTVYVTRASQRMIVLGRDGRTIKAIGSAARGELAEILETPVHLFLFVKVRENWREDPERYREMGLDMPKD